MTVGTRMWSEQPNPVQAMRGPVVAEPLVDVPVDMAQSWAGVWEHNAAYGDGQIYGRPPASLPVHILAPAGGIPTGVPVLVLIKSDMWDGFTPPAGWVKEWEVPNGDSCAAAWKIDKYHDYQKVRRDIAAVKVAMPGVLHDVVMRAMQLHGSLGVSDEMPFVKMLVASQSLAIADGPTEVHKLTVARRTLREYEPVDTAFPSAHLPTRKAAAQARLELLRVLADVV
jgi:hypothetical protein